MIRVVVALGIALFCALPAAAQTSLSLGAITADPSLPVEITADNLTVDQSTGQAVFEGNVRVGQGDLRLAAGRVTVVYNDATGNISRLVVSGGVTFVTATEAAEANSAEYDIDGGRLILTGDVLLTQGPSAISANRMDVNLATGAAQLSGNVRTIFQQGGN